MKKRITYLFNSEEIKKQITGLFNSEEIKKQISHRTRSVMDNWIEENKGTITSAIVALIGAGTLAYYLYTKSFNFWYKNFLKEIESIPTGEDILKDIITKDLKRQVDDIVLDVFSEDIK